MNTSAEPEKVKVPTPEMLMWPVLEAMKKLGGVATNEDLLTEVINQERIPEPVQSVPTNQAGDTKLYHNLRFAQMKLKRSGAIENRSHGLWAITQDGRALTEDQVKQIPSELRKQGAAELGSVDEDVELHFDTWKAKLLDVLTNDETMKPDAFERLAKTILSASGFIQVEVTGRTGDGGIDGDGIFRLKEGLLSFKVCFQCKRYKGSVSSSEIQKFRGAMMGRGMDRGLFLTTGVFTTNAKREAARVSPPIDLVDGEALCNLLKDLRLGVRIVERVIIDPEWFMAI